MLQRSALHTESYLIKQLPQAIAFINMNEDIILTSDQWVADFSPLGDSCTGMSITHLFSHQNKNWQKTLAKCLEFEPGIPMVERYHDDYGNEKWFELSKTAWHDDKENVIGWIIQGEKISQRVHNEVQLDKLHIFSAEMSDIAKIGLWEYNVADDELKWSEMTKIIHEVPLDYVPALDEATNFYKSGHSRNTIAMTVQNAIVNQTSWSEKLQLVTAKGNEVWVITSGKPIYKNGEFTGLIGTIQNINSIALSEIKTRENEYHLRTLIDNLPLNVFIKDLDSRKILVNKSEMKYCGVSKESEILGKDDFEFLDQETAKKSRKDDLRVMHDLKTVLSKEMVHFKNDGTKTVFLTSKIPLVHNDGSAYGLVGISMDISELKEKEEELKALISVTSLQNEKLLNFAHIVSHNLRSHTANFSMLLDFLTYEKDEAEKQKIMKMLTSASDNLLETLDNLNQVVDINSKTGLKKKPINLRKEITSTEKNLTAELSEHRVKIINQIDPKVSVNVVPVYLKSILLNFLSNAIKYRSPQRKPIIKLNTTSENGYTVLSIQDNGLGIDLKKYGDKLFGMYKTFHDNVDSRGFGLYITKSQIEAMKGTVSVDSSVGHGTTFKIYFNEND
jgi:PAS domain S-box-containing protein